MNRKSIHSRQPRFGNPSERSQQIRRRFWNGRSGLCPHEFGLQAKMSALHPLSDSQFFGTPARARSGLLSFTFVDKTAGAQRADDWALFAALSSSSESTPRRRQRWSVNTPIRLTAARRDVTLDQMRTLAQDGAVRLRTKRRRA
jgi:hypothetical protein